MKNKNYAVSEFANSVVMLKFATKDGARKFEKMLENMRSNENLPVKMHNLLEDELFETELLN